MQPPKLAASGARLNRGARVTMDESLRLFDGTNAAILVSCTRKPYRPIGGRRAHVSQVIASPFDRLNVSGVQNEAFALRYQHW